MTIENNLSNVTSIAEWTIMILISEEDFFLFECATMSQNPHLPFSNSVCSIRPDLSMSKDSKTAFH